MGPPCCHGAETLPSSPWVSVPVAEGQGGSVPASLRDVQPGSLLPSQSLAIVESAAGCRKDCGGEGACPACRGQHKARLCCWGDALPSLPSAPAWLPALLAQGTAWEAARRPAQPVSPQSWSPGPASPRPERPRPLRRRSQAPIKTTFYSFPPLGHSTEHTSPSAQQHTRLFKRKHNSSVYFTTVRIFAISTHHRDFFVPC